MKIMKEVEFSEVVEIEITSSDVIEALSQLELSKSDYEFKRVLNTCLSLVAKVPDEIIERLGENVRANVVRHLEAQISRYKEKP